MLLAQRRRFVIVLLFFVVPAFAQVSSDSLGVMSFLRLSNEQNEVYSIKVSKVASETGMSESILNDSPTVLAMTGLDALRRRDIPFAQKMAAKLERLSVERAGAKFYEFRRDYVATWPYKLKAPWVSALSQGLALALNTNLYLATGKLIYRKSADKIANSYLVSIDKGGFLRWLKEGVVFEEYPLNMMTAVLNGNAIATLSLSDYIEVFGGRHEFENLLIGSKAFLETNIHRYTVTTKEFPTPVSAYSLAPRRIELLMRFIGGSLAVHQITVSGNEKNMLTVGNNNDHEPSSSAYIWLNQKYQNWGQPTYAQGKLARSIIDGQGLYNHAPFSFALTDAELSEPLSLEVEAINLGKTPVQVQLYDGTVYHTLGIISPGVSLGKPTRYFLPASILEVMQNQYRNQSPPLEPSYFSDNQLLVELLATRFNSQILKKWAALMRGSTHLTPSIFDARSMLEWFIEEPKKIISPNYRDVEASHVEYPSVISRAGVWYFFYSAIGKDSRSRIRVRISSDREGYNFNEPSNVLDEINPNMPIKGNYAFPSVIRDPIKERYVMVFSGACNPGGKYDAIWISESMDLVNWSVPRMIISEGGLDPSVWFDGDLFHVVYSMHDGLHSLQMNEVLSTNLELFSAPNTVWFVRTLANNFGLYTSTRFEIDSQEFFIVDVVSGTDRKEWRLLCRGNDGRLQALTDEVLMRTGRESLSWDAYKYCMTIFKAGDDNYLLFSGMPLDSEIGGSIGIVKIDIDAFKKFKSSPQCSH